MALSWRSCRCAWKSVQHRRRRVLNGHCSGGRNSFVIQDTNQARIKNAQWGRLCGGRGRQNDRPPVPIVPNALNTTCKAVCMHPLNWGVGLFESALIIVSAFLGDPPPSPTAALRLLAFSDRHPFMPRHIIILIEFRPARPTPFSLPCPIIDPSPHLLL